MVDAERMSAARNNRGRATGDNSELEACLGEHLHAETVFDVEGFKEFTSFGVDDDATVRHYAVDVKDDAADVLLLNKRDGLIVRHDH